MPDKDQLPPQHFAVTAAAFEGGIAILAVVAGLLLGQRPLASFSWDMADVGWGIAATLPLLGLLWFCVVSRWPPLVKIYKIIDEVLVPLFATCGLLEFAAIALLAGLGEEMLFRGVVQSALMRWIGGPAGVWLALAFAGLLFGLAHAVTFTYILLAGLIGVYLGWVWLLTGNLLVPIIAHAVYDFTALVYLVRIRGVRRKKT
jgi:uncharacterized protein